MGLTQNVLSKNVCFYKYAHNSVPRWSPDMILIAFDGKFQEKKDEIPPRACRPVKKFQKFKKNVPGNGSPARPSARAGGLGGAAPREQKRGCFLIYDVNNRINKFTKSPSSRDGIPRFGFLVANSIIKDQKPAWWIAI